MKILNKVKDFIIFWGESFLIGPIVIILTYCAIIGINQFVGRPLLDDPSFLITNFYSLIKAVLVMMATGFAQNFLFGYRSKVAGARLRDDIYDGSITCFLLLLFTYIIIFT